MYESGKLWTRTLFMAREHESYVHCLGYCGDGIR